MSDDFVRCMSDERMFSECVEESVCNYASEDSREVADGLRQLQGNQLAARVWLSAGANNGCTFEQ